MKPLNKLKELHAKTTQGEWLLKHEKLKHFENDILANCDHCFEEPFVMAQMNRHMDNWKNDAEFIAEAHKLVPRLIEALEKCIEQRNRNISMGGITENTLIETCDEELEQILEGKE